MRKQTLNITGPWEFREFPETARRMSDLNEGRWLKTDQPQSIYLSLAQAKILAIEDIYAQPAMFIWVQRQPWVFRTQFSLSEEQAAIQHKELVFEGLDTAAQIWLNEKLLGRTDNMFMTHRFDVSSLIRPQQNSLVVQFLPAREYAEKLLKRQAKTDNSSEPAYACLRKAQYHFGSVLGPSVVNCGISGPVRLELTQQAGLADIHLRTIDCNESFADIRAAIAITAPTQNPGDQYRCILKISGQGPVLSHTLEFAQQQCLSTVLRLERPVLWQPKGYGAPFRYRIQVSLYNGDMLIDQKELFFGIRTIRMLRQHGQANPSAMEINQQSIEFKGVFWTPVGLLSQMDDRDKKNALLNRLADANVNMLCVWADGGYEDDDFYEYCDRMGIMVWQELAFPPPLFPDRSWMTTPVRHEMEQKVCRLRNHACLIGWCSGFSDWLHVKLPEKKKTAAYREAGHREMTELLNEWDPDRDFMCGSRESIAAGNSASQASVPDYPDTQSVFLPPQQDIPAALPCLKTLQIACSSEQIFPASAWIERQIYHPASWFLSARTDMLFAPPKTIEQQIYQTQITQARWMKKRIESVRGNSQAIQQIMPWTAGQFWPSAAFSMLDFSMRPNAAYYYTKRGFAPVMVCLTANYNSRQSADTFSAAAAIVNDRIQSLAGKIVFELLDMKGQLLDTAEFPVLISPRSKITDIILPRAFLNPTFPQKSILRLAVIEQQQRIAENLYFYSPDKYIAFKPLEIDFVVRPVSEQEVMLCLKSRYFVKDLELVAPQDAYLENNFFDLLPGQEYELAARFSEPIIRLDAPWILRSVNEM